MSIGHPLAFQDWDGSWGKRSPVDSVRLELPLGHSYPLQIRAVLRDGSWATCVWHGSSKRGRGDVGGEVVGLNWYELVIGGEPVNPTERASP